MASKSSFEKRKTNNKVIAIVVTIIILCAGGIGVAGAYHEHEVTKQHVKAKTPNKHQDEIKKVNQLKKEMAAEKDEQKKLADLKQLEQEYQRYQKKSSPYLKLTNAYQDAIHSGKVYFLNKTNEVIKANTITDIQSATDIDGLQDKSAALKEQLKFVRDNKEIVYSQANVKDYTKQINDLGKTKKCRPSS